MVTITCPNCSFRNPGDSAFCEDCGKPLTFKCSNCGEVLTANVRYCKHCGAPQISSRPLARAEREAGGPGISHWLPDEGARLAALHRSMPEQLAQKILSTRDHVEGERKQVTVLFTDIVDSTTLAEQMDPEEWATIVNGAHRLVTLSIYQYEGTVAQLLGDGVLCFFGAPISHEDDPERAVRAALGIITGVQDYAVKVKQSYGISEFQLRLGMNTGVVVVGSVGSGPHFEYLAIGDTVNLAARMQTEAQPNTVLMTENTHRLVSTLFDFHDRGELHVKGKSAPVHAYQVAGERYGAPKKRGITGLSSPMVGREREFASLKRLTEELTSGRGTIVSVLGEAGLGKSRLLAEWRRWVLETRGHPDGEARKKRRGAITDDALVGRPRIRWAEGRCRSYGVTVAYHLLVDLTRSLLEVPEDLADHEMRQTLQSRLKEMFSDKTWSNEDDYLFLAHMLSLKLEPEEAERIKYLGPQAFQMQYAGVIRRAFSSLAKETPTIIVCEDIHWADVQSVELLSVLLPLVEELPLLVCLVARPDDNTPGAQLIRTAREIPGVGAIELHLSTLSDGESRQLVSNLMPGDLPGPVRDLILSKAEGNPFFVEEVIGFLVDRGFVQRREVGWVATQDIRQIEIPETIQGVLMARVDQLAEETRHTLQVASVIGREFSLELLLNVLQRQEGRGFAN